MSYNETYAKIYRELLQVEGDFNMKSVMVTAFLNSPEHFTKKQIKELALQVLDDSLNNGMILMVGEGVYVSVLSKEADKLKGVVKYGVVNNWRDNDSLSRHIKSSVFDTQTQNEEETLSK